MSETESKKPVASNTEATFAALNKKFKGLDKLPEPAPITEDDVLPTPSVGLNLICGKDKGIRKGSIVLWYGPYGSMKTWIALEMCREAQKKWPDKIVAYFDTECRVSMETAANLIGVNLTPHDTGVPRFIYRRPKTAEQAWEEMGALAASGLCSLIVLDSNTAMRAERIVEDKDFNYGQVGLAARISSAGLNKYAPDFEATGTILWCISQMRVESQGQHMVKSPTGGNAWLFYSTHEFKVEQVEKKRGEEEERLHIFTKKNKFSRSLLSHEIPVVMGKGIDQEADLILTAVGEGFVSQSGAYYKYKGEPLGQGMAKSCQYLKDNPEIKAAILAELYQD